MATWVSENTAGYSGDRKKTDHVKRVDPGEEPRLGEDQAPVTSTSSKHVTESDFVHSPMPPLLWRSSVTSTTCFPSRKATNVLLCTSTRSACQTPFITFASAPFN